MTNVPCTHCGTPLTGSLDTYGDVRDEQCFACYFADVLEVDVRELELLETIRLSEMELDAVEDMLLWDSELEADEVEDYKRQREFFRVEIIAALADLEIHRERRYEPLNRWLEIVGIA
jgi:hypothetical protein